CAPSKPATVTDGTPGQGSAAMLLKQMFETPLLGASVDVSAPEQPGHRPRAVGACCVQANESMTVVPSAAKNRTESTLSSSKPAAPVDDRQAARAERRAGGDGVLRVRVVTVQELEPGQIRDGCGGVDELDPVSRRSSIRLDLVDLDARRWRDDDLGRVADGARR